MKLSVVIPAYNAEKTIGEQLEALARQMWPEPWEVLVVNNRSTDATVATVQLFADRLPNLRVIEAAGRQGAAYAMNTGVRHAAADAIAFCDADDVVADGWVAAMGEGLERYAFVSGPFEIDRLNYLPLQKHRVNSQPTGVQQYTYPPFLPHAGAGNMGVRRKVFDEVRGFDESLPALFDTDFCWKVQLAGIPLTPLPDAVLHVRFRDTAAGLVRQARLYAEYDVLLYKRYRPYGMPKLRLRDGLKAWVGLVLNVLSARAPDKRPRYLWDLAWRAGRLYGSIKYRTVAL